HDPERRLPPVIELVDPPTGEDDLLAVRGELRVLHILVVEVVGEGQPVARLLGREARRHDERDRSERGQQAGGHGAGTVKRVGVVMAAPGAAPWTLLPARGLGKPLGPGQYGGSAR